jgi:hypothetical protein
MYLVATAWYVTGLLMAVSKLHLIGWQDSYLSVAEKLSHKAIILTIIIMLVLVISRISKVAPLLVVHHTIWLMPLTTPFWTYNSNFQQQRKLKASLNQCPLNYLKSTAYITSPLNHSICNTSLLSGTFPQHLKYSTVKLLFKIVDSMDVSNYRPISIPTSF